MKQNQNMRRSPAGMKHTIYSPKDGPKPSDIRKRGFSGITHDYSDVYGWNKKK